mmetsp:Transcript_9180/g.40215  ORF Transcript_9180/g.40215 Transcript_9180/m.40215 type:complete len:91 (+) Transcript_9180:424-696(+)
MFRGSPNDISDRSQERLELRKKSRTAIKWLGQRLKGRDRCILGDGQGGSQMQRDYATGFTEVEHIMDHMGGRIEGWPRAMATLEVVWSPT